MKGLSQETQPGWGRRACSQGWVQETQGHLFQATVITGTPPGMAQGSPVTAPGCLCPLNQPPSTLDMHIAQTGLGPLPSCIISRFRKGLRLLGTGKWAGNSPSRFYRCLSTLNNPSKK